MRRLRHTYLYLVALLTITAPAFIGLATAQKMASPKPDRIALGEQEVEQLLLLMDTDQNGKISKQEFMSFMEAEFDRLDKDKSGALDPKELTGSQIRVSHFKNVGK
jgi:Ca2+-binding EF-hand superfamily protein